MSRIAKCACPECSSIGTHKVDLYRRGGRSAFLCDFHYGQEESYYTKNNETCGTKKVHPYTFGVELETSFTSEKAKLELLNDGFLPTHDGSIYGSEYKSCIYQGLNALSKHVTTIGRMIDEGEMRIGNECGTHTHVGNRDMINPETMEYVRRFYHSLFVELSDEMRINPAKVEKLFGRGFTYYASPIDSTSDPREHTNFINLQHGYTIEYRIVKFRNAKQYMAAVKFAQAATEAVVNNFIAHFNDNDFDTKRYPTIREYRKHKAQVASKKIVKLFHKFADSI